MVTAIDSQSISRHIKQFFVGKPCGCNELIHFLRLGNSTKTCLF